MAKDERRPRVVCNTLTQVKHRLGNVALPEFREKLTDLPSAGRKQIDCRLFCLVRINFVALYNQETDELNLFSSYGCCVVLKFKARLRRGVF
jgi:hypothetical protein